MLTLQPAPQHVSIGERSPCRINSVETENWISVNPMDSRLKQISLPLRWHTWQTLFPLTLHFISSKKVHSSLSVLRFLEWNSFIAFVEKLKLTVPSLFSFLILCVTIGSACKRVFLFPKKAVPIYLQSNQSMNRLQLSTRQLHTHVSLLPHVIVPSIVSKKTEPLV